jgi:hypothetical protein
MIFTIHAAGFINMVQSVTEAAAAQKRASGTLRLVASQGHVYAVGGDKVAKADAVVWEEGQCAVAPAELLSVLKTYRYENVTIEADWQWLRVGGLAISVKRYCPWAEAPHETEMVATD